MRHYDIPALPTLYNGTTYRSRLEARIAVFFDALKIPYDYEPKIFNTHLGGYLPDFYLPQTDWYVEAKPNKPTDEEIAKVLDVSLQGNNIAILSGVPSIVTKVRFYQQGQEVFFKPSYWKKISAYWAMRPEYVLVNLINLQKLTGKKDFNRAFILAKGYDFER